MHEYRNKCGGRRILTEKEKEEEERLDAIIEEASKLPLELQEYILATIKGMLLVKEQTIKHEHAAIKSSEK